MAHEAGARIESPQAIGVEFGEPDITMAIQCQVVGSARKCERLACIAGIGYCEGRQRVELKLPHGGKVVPDVVGVLFGEPDGIVRSNLHPHHPEAAMWWRHLLKGLCPRVENGEVIPTHFPEPDPSFMIDRQSHDLTV